MKVCDERNWGLRVWVSRGIGRERRVWHGVVVGVGPMDGWVDGKHVGGCDVVFPGHLDWYSSDGLEGWSWTVLYET